MVAGLTGDFRLEKLGVHLGARVDGIALDVDQTPALKQQLREALHQNGVLIFEFEAALDQGEFDRFGTLFGEPEGPYALSTVDADSPSRMEAMLIDSEKAPMQDYGINRWHSDGTALECPPQAAMLTPVALPEIGGSTMWASMYAAWDALSPRYQQLLDGLEVVHGTMRLSFLKKATSAIHPAVIRDPVTGRKALFINANYSERILGLTQFESDSLLQMLFQHINTPEFHFRLTWKPGMVVVWEERVTQHRGVADFTGPRKMRRMTFRGERPAA